MLGPFGSKHAPNQVNTINPEWGEINLLIDPAFSSWRGEAGNRQVGEEAFASVASRTGQESLHEALMQFQQLGRAISFHDHGPGLVPSRQADDAQGREFKGQDAATRVLKRVENHTCCSCRTIAEEEGRAMHLLHRSKSMSGQCQRGHKACHGFRDFFRGIESDEESLHSSLVLSLGHSSNSNRRPRCQKRKSGGIAWGSCRYHGFFADGWSAMEHDTMNTGFENREEGHEAKIKHDADVIFRIHARRDKLLGQWAAERMGLEADAIDEYAIELVKHDIKEPGDEDVIEKLTADFKARGVEMDEEAIRQKLAEYEAIATDQVQGEGYKQE